ncbi:hypothetical protein PS2015_1823 [Pseudohongiella spirulinae]|uniref:Uncharacterized protein n=1 Tax=Pseudohongiella spirulinae TaxID=1249552 RepID=A0A0S2KDU5_9GAMM|nr:hypothetical protein PS2015_1823 [Pseudohongiella spirulinae]
MMSGAVREHSMARTGGYDHNLRGSKDHEEQWFTGVLERVSVYC